MDFTPRSADSDARVTQNPRSRFPRTGLSVLLVVVTLPVASQDWPQFLGPNRNGSTSVTNLASQWPKEGPPVAWQRKVGQSFAGPIVSGGKLIVFHRIDNKEVVECLDAKSGNELWKADYPTSYVDQMGHDPGPRSTPAISEGRAYTFGAEGMMSCWSLADGKNFGASQRRASSARAWDSLAWPARRLSRGTR